MMRRAIALIIAGLVLAGPAAADEGANSDNGIERTAKRAGAAVDRAAHKAWHGVRKAAVKTGEALQKAGRKTAKWIDEKTS